ncbi:hypothetical protein [Dokdonia sp. PRO95]|uniref:hypothetical protein n=1 Tax=unclassified Dokdonia TaxID=2615033 RepID=UPI000550A7CC|nr:hypothetical protein [Dokdonia sp. PRO95]
MNFKKIIACERKSLEKLSKFQLPHKFKRIGWILFIASFLSLIATSIIVTDYTLKSTIIIIVKYTMLVGLLTVSLSKEPIEDEFIKSMRMRSYMIAFIVGVLQTLVMPFINLGADALINGGSSLKPVNDFFVLWVLLFCQILFFHLFKSGADD